MELVTSDKAVSASSTLNRDGEVPSKKELSSYFDELLVVKFPVKRNLIPQMRNFSPTLTLNVLKVSL